MAAAIPTAATLAKAAAACLEAGPGGEAGAASEARSYDLKIARRLLRIVEREKALGPALDKAEAAWLQTYLGRKGQPRELYAALCDGIRAGRFGFEDEALMAFLYRAAADRLAIDNPRYPPLRRAGGKRP